MDSFTIPFTRKKKSLAPRYNTLMKLLAIDPGYERLGIAVMEKPARGREVLLYSDCFRTSAKLPFSERLSMIGGEIARLIKEFKPEALALETLFFSTSKTTAMRVAEARGVIVYEAARHDIAVKEFGPGEIKAAIGSDGRADKKQIMAMLPRLITIEKPIKHDDEYDAIAVGLTFFATRRV